MYDGIGVDKDYRRAVFWYRVAAVSGLPSAKKNLGLCYAYGRGVGQDVLVAVCLFQIASEKGCNDAKQLLTRFKEVFAL